MYYGEALARSLFPGSNNGAQAINNFRNDLAGLRSQINMFIQELKTMPIPAVIPMFLRHYWLAENVFTDADSTKSQIYAFRPNTIWQYDEIKGRLNPINSFSGSGITGLASLRSYWDGLFQAIRNSESAGIMSGDLIKVFGNQMLVEKELEDGETLQIGYSDEILSQIENLTLCGEAVNNPATNIAFPTFDNLDSRNVPGYYQTASGNVYMGYLDQEGDLETYTEGIYIRTNVPRITGHLVEAPNSYVHKNILNMHKKESTIDEVLVATRGMVNGKLTIPPNTANFYFSVAEAGTEIFCQARIYTIRAVNDGTATTLGNSLTMVFNYWSNLDADVGVDNGLNDLVVYYTFDWAPGFVGNSVLPVGADQYRFVATDYRVCDYDTYVEIPENTLTILHLGAVSSELGVPTILQLMDRAKR